MWTKRYTSGFLFIYIDFYVNGTLHFRNHGHVIFLYCSGYFRYWSSQITVIQNCFGLAPYLPNGCNPLRNAEFVKSQAAFDTQLQITGTAPHPSLLSNLKRATKNQLVADAALELGVPAVDLSKRIRGSLIDLIIDHRISNGTFLGIKYLHELIVDEQHPFCIYVHPVKDGMCQMRLRFRLRKSEPIFLGGTVPPVTINGIYS